MVKRLLLMALVAAGLGWSAPAEAQQNCVIANGVTTCANTFRFKAPTFLTQGAIGANAPQLDGTVTFTNGGVTYTAWRLNVTDNASATASLLMDLQVAGTSKFNVRKDGSVLIGGGTTSPFIYVGGTTSSFPCFKRNAAQFDVRLCDDSNYAAIAAIGYDMPTTGRITKQGSTLISGTAPTISSGFGSSPSIVASNSTAAFTVNVGTGGAATTGVIGLPTATTGWICTCTDITTASTTVTQCKQTASSTASATIGQFAATGSANAWAASDIVAVSCFAY